MRSATGVIQPIAVEVELTPKAPRRLLAIIRAWRGAEWARRGPLLLRAGPDPPRGRARRRQDRRAERVASSRGAAAMTRAQGHVALDISAHLWAIAMPL